MIQNDIWLCFLIQKIINPLDPFWAKNKYFLSKYPKQGSSLSWNSVQGVCQKLQKVKSKKSIKEWCESTTRNVITKWWKKYEKENGKKWWKMIECL